jgi:uncharacterized protein (DUF4415 family)
MGVNNPFKKEKTPAGDTPKTPIVPVITPKAEKDLSDVYEEKAKKKKKIVGFHLEQDVREIIEGKSKEFGRGWQSDITNDLLRKYFKSKGWL